MLALYSNAYSYPGVQRMRNPVTKVLDPVRNWDQTTASRVIPGSTALHMRLFPKKFAKCSTFCVQNGEECGVNEWVIAKSDDGYHYISKVIEILQVFRIISR